MSSRMNDLFEIEGFKDTLKTLYLNDELVAGAQCPAPDCNNGTLKEKSVSYIDHSVEPWKFCEVDLLVCRCGFQFRRKEEV